MTDRYAVLIDGHPRAVEIEDVVGAAGNLRVVVDGRERLVDARALGHGVWSVLDGADARLLQIDGAGPKLTVEVSHPDGDPRICIAAVTDGRAPSGDLAAAAPGGQSGPLTVRAPIPGRVVKLLVKAGDSVKAGQTLLVLEAMKMENELRAPRASAVAAVHVAEGMAVETGQNLVSLE